MVEAFTALCMSGRPTADAVRTLALRDEWRAAGSQGDLTKASDQGLLVLDVSNDESVGEGREVCSVGAPSASPDTVKAPQNLLGFKPALNLGASAIFFAVLDPAGWRSGAALSPSAVEAAKRDGLFYSLMALEGEQGSKMLALHVMAPPVAPAH